MTPSAAVIPQVFQAAVLHMVQALNGYMAALPNPVPGNPPIAAPVYPLFQDPTLTSPACTVTLKPGPHPFGAGESWDDADDVTGVPSFQVYVPNCRLDCAVYCHLPGMAGYVADCLYAGALANFAANPITGEVVEDAVGKHLAESGLTLTGLADWVEIASNPESPRPYGQFFQIHVIFSANLDLMWTGGTTPVAPILIQTGVAGNPISETFSVT